MNNIKVGLVGSIITAICCFTPLLVIIFGALGISALLFYLDFILLPLLAIFIGILAFGLYSKYIA